MRTSKVKIGSWPESNWGDGRFGHGNALDKEDTTDWILGQKSSRVKDAYTSMSVDYEADVFC